MHQIPKEFKVSIQKALSFYPELELVHIQFVIRPMQLPYAAQPIPNSIFRKGKRKYRILISNESTVLRAPTLMQALSFEARVGAMGHELAHIFDYEQMNNTQLLNFGVRYLFEKEKIEKRTDRIALAQGLGAYLLQWSKEVYPIKCQDGNRGQIYYGPEEIQKLLEEENFI